ncbi:MAG: acyl-CoA dehydrogenase family protein, partial [Myxococcota bacterium]
MDFDFTPEDEAFRAEVRDFIKKYLPKKGKPEEIFEWQRQARAKRYVGFSWPKEVGGGGGTLSQQVILKEELARAKAPALGTC